jgi:CyaY protein
MRPNRVDENRFDALALAALETLERALEACGADLDYEMKEGGIVEIEFDDGAKIIVNRHVAAREIWVAARSGGFHYRWDGAAWRDTRDGSELFEALSKLLSAGLGRGIRLRG